LSTFAQGSEQNLYQKNEQQNMAKQKREKYMKKVISNLMRCDVFTAIVCFFN